MVFSIIELKNYRRNKINLCDKDFFEKSELFLKEKNKVVGTFDYHFVANYSPAIFKEITENTFKDLSPSIDFLIPISKLIVLSDFADLDMKPFSGINIGKLANHNNLVVGNNIKVNQQSAAYHNGMYKQVHDKIIQPVSIDEYKIDLFDGLLKTFNPIGNIKVLNTIKILSSQNIEMTIFNELKKQFGGKILLAIFVKYKLPKYFMKSFYSIGLRFQIYQGDINTYKLSNYSVKCLEKIGGILNIIDNTFEDETTYFLGIDLGHTTVKNEKFSNLGLALFNNKGILLCHFVNKNIPRNEVINSEVIWSGMLYFSKYIKRKK